MYGCLTVCEYGLQQLIWLRIAEYMRSWSCTVLGRNNEIVKFLEAQGKTAFYCHPNKDL